MKKIIFSFCLFFVSYFSFSQTPEIGHFEQMKTIRRGDTLDVTWYYKPALNLDIRTFQVDWEYKKNLLTYVSTTVDPVVNGNSPQVSYKSWDNYRFDKYSLGSYSYVEDTSWVVGRNYLVLPSGAGITANSYIIHNKYLINNVPTGFNPDTVKLNWARLFRVDGTTIGDNVAILNYKNLQLKLSNNLTISGRLWLPETATMRGWFPTVYCYNNQTNELVSQSAVAASGLYNLTNIDENTKYRIQVKFRSDSLQTIRDNSVTISDAVKTFNEFINTDINQNYGRQYLKNGLSYLISDVNKNSQLDGGDPYGIYASVSGLRPIDTSNLIHVFTAQEFDNLVSGDLQWNTWTNYSNRGNFIIDSVGTTNLNLDLKYFILGDVDRSHSSPVLDALGAPITSAIYNGVLDVEIPNTYSVGQPLFVPFNVSTNGGINTGLQFEMLYDVKKVKLDEIVSNISAPWLQYVTHDEVKGIVRFGGMNNQSTGNIMGKATPFKLKFSPKNPGEDISSYVHVRKLMDASDINGDHFNIALSSDKVLLAYKSNGKYVFNNVEPTALIRPNPNTGQFELVVTLPSNSFMNASIYDYSGNKLLDLGNVRTDDYQQTIVKNVNASRLSQGTYLVVLSDGNKIITKPFIKS